MRPLAVLRPEPGNAATAARIEAAGGRALRLPLFLVVPLAWDPPDPVEFDALFLTSANTVRQAGPGLARYRDLPVYAVGQATAAAARAAGFDIAVIGASDAAALAKAAVDGGVKRALHLAGRERAVVELPAVIRTIAVYGSDARPLQAADLRPLAGAVALIHSARAGTLLAALVPDRSHTAVAAISAAALAAAGPGWAATAIAAMPDDAALIAAGMMLAD